MTDTVSGLAQKLRPYWLRDVDGTAARLTVSGSGGGGGVTDHGLLSGLADDDHTQYLNTTRGDARYYTETETDAWRSSHIANADIHHNRQHGILSSADHTVTGSQWQVVGLTAANTLGLLTPIQNPGATERILKTDSNGALQLASLEVTNTLYATGTLDFGTNTMYEDGSNLRVDGSKPVRFAQAIGGPSNIWSIATSGLGTFKGGVDITTGGDLYVAASGFYAGNPVLFADSSGGNVGILCTPDPQFALDINGPARAQYWIGPHAIQLKDVLLLSHFDGRYPIETNFSGEPNGHMGQVATVQGGIVFRHGKFGKALQHSHFAANLVTNPSFETGTTSWTWNDANASGSTPATSNTYGYYHTGAAALRLANTVAGENDYMAIDVTGLAASTTYTVSAWVYVVSFTGGALSNRGLIAYDAADVGGTLQSTTITGATGEWVRHVVTLNTTAAVGSHTIQIRLYAPRGYVIWDSVQCEARAYATPYCDGSLGGYSALGVPDGSGHAWAGTPHASASSRAPGVFYYPTAGNVSPSSGTVMAWVNFAGITGSAQTVLRVNGTGSFIILRLDSTGKPNAWAGAAGVTATSALAANTWYHLAFTYSAGGTVRIYVNGAEVVSGASSGFAGMPDIFYVGSNGAADYLNGFLDDLCILERVLPAGEILSIYESNAPVFAETARFSFRATPKNLVWADDEGLWMRAVNGDPVLGVYGGEAATKSWGGQTLAAGDLLIGRSTQYVMWDDSAGTLTVSGTINVIGGNAATTTALTAGLAGKISTGGAEADITTISGGKITTGTLTGDKVALTSYLAINNSTYGADGVQIQYNAGNPRAYIGNGSTRYFQFDGTDISWAGVNTSLTAGGTFSATDAVFGVGSTTGQTKADSTGIYIDAQSSFLTGYGYKFKLGGSIGAGLTSVYAAGTSVNTFLWSNTTSQTGANALYTNIDTGLYLRNVASTNGKTSTVDLSAWHAGTATNATTLTLTNNGITRSISMSAGAVYIDNGAGNQIVYHAGNLTSGLGSYATTAAVTTALGSYLPLAGGTVTGVLTTSNVLQVGNLIRYTPRTTEPFLNTGDVMTFTVYNGTTYRYVIAHNHGGTVKFRYMNLEDIGDPVWRYSTVWSGVYD